jgi:hypothetical protein
MDYLEEYKKIFNNGRFIRHGKKITLNDFPIFDGSGIKLLLDKILLELKDKKSVTLLDYGCGSSSIWHESIIGQKRQNLFEILGPKIQSFHRYDPRNEAFSKKLNSKFDIIICSNVLEFFSKIEISKILKELQDFSNESTHIFYTINTGPSKNFFLNGTNMHVTQESADFWINMLKEFNNCKISVAVDKKFLI